MAGRAPLDEENLRAMLFHQRIGNDATRAPRSDDNEVKLHELPLQVRGCP